MTCYQELLGLLNPDQVRDLERVSARLIDNPEELDNRDPTAVSPFVEGLRKERPPHVR